MLARALPNVEVRPGERLTVAAPGDRPPPSKDGWDEIEAAYEAWKQIHSPAPEECRGYPPQGTDA